ncbi:MAG: thioredoxin family protein [Thermoleophilaceae bacterium]|nr:thioredoxin family protein [Thermoleophilaceae bacterium]
MKIEILYFDGCPSYETLVPRLHELVSELDPDAAIELRHIERLDQAEEERFLGSPTVRVNGADIDPTAAERTDYGLNCRLYRSDDGASGVPPEQWLRAAIRAARTTG